MERINLNNVLLALGLAGTFVPDIVGLSAALAGMGVGWLTWVAKGLAALALILGGLSRAVPRLRPLLAAMKLATPAGPAQSSQDAPDAQAATPSTSDEAIARPETPSSKGAAK